MGINTRDWVGSAQERYYWRTLVELLGFIIHGVIYKSIINHDDSNAKKEFRLPRIDNLQGDRYNSGRHFGSFFDQQSLRSSTPPLLASNVT